MAGEQSRPPNPGSAAAAVQTLRAELDMIDRALDALDRKAALVPPALGVIAGLFVAPDTTFTEAQRQFLVLALATGVTSVLASLVAVWSRDLHLGPKAKATVKITYLEPAVFDQSVAEALADTVCALSDLSREKGEALNGAVLFAAATILLLAVARAVGGIGP